MAGNKTGLNFYRTDTDRYQDMRIKRLKKDFGCSGIAVYDYLLCEIYRVQGCFIVWDENTVFDVAEYFGLKETLVNEIITYCGVVGLFDKGLLCRGKIITSRSIQQRYLNMCAAAKRQNVKIPEEIAILPEESPKLPEESTETSGSFPHSIVEYSKEENNTPPIIPLAGDEGEKRFVKPTIEQVSSYCQSRNNGIDAEEFIDHYESNGWKVGRTKMKDWQAAVRTWEKKRKGVQSTAVNHTKTIFS